MTNKITINTDGGARGNPGKAAIGFVIKFTQNGSSSSHMETIKVGKYIGEATNNIAEYTALLEALNEVKNISAGEVEIECLLDSELVVRQINGQYKVKDENLKKYWEKIKTIQLGFSKITFKHVPRAQNKEADAIVNEVLDSQQ